MTRYIAFLRAINVGGRNVKMEELRVLFESFGLEQVETFIASGNVIFHNKTNSAAGLEQQIEAGLHTALGFEVKTFLRTDAAVAAVARYQPFQAANFAVAAAYNVGFLAEPLAAEAERLLLALKTDIDDFHVKGREVYWLCQQKQSDSTFSNAVFERTLGVRATFRGMKTVQKLAAKYPLNS